MMGCQDTTEISEQETNEAVTIIESVFAQSSIDVGNATSTTTSSFGRGGYGFGFGFGDCIGVTREDNEGGYPKTITIDYGVDCTYNDVTKSGKLVITVTGSRNETGTQWIVDYDQFTVNGYLFSGTEIFTNTGGGAYTISMTDGKIVTPEGEEITWVHDKVRNQIAGTSTEERNDDGFETIGTSYGISTEGFVYQREITSPLITYGSCFWVMSGVVESTVGEVSYTIDFGDGTCDNIATRTENGVTEEFTMDFRMKKFRRGKAHD